MRFDDRAEAQRAARDRQTRFESAQLVGVILCREPAGEEGDLASARLESGEQLAGDGADRKWIGRNRASRGVSGASVMTQTTGISLLAALPMCGFSAAGFPGAMISPLVPRAVLPRRAECRPRRDADSCGNPRAAPARMAPPPARMPSRSESQNSAISRGRWTEMRSCLRDFR